MGEKVVGSGGGNRELRSRSLGRKLAMISWIANVCSNCRKCQGLGANPTKVSKNRAILVNFVEISNRAL